MKTFALRNKDGTRVLEEYWPITVEVGGVHRTFALHRTKMGDYRVSDIESGGSVIPQVTAWHKGVPCSTQGVNLGECRELAIAQVRALVKRVGVKHFERVLAQANADRPKPRKRACEVQS